MGRRRLPPAFSGFALVDKPPGWTSHDVVQRLRRTFGQRQVGHTGTLDPMATGLLVVALGSTTRLARFVESQHKAYEAVVELGVATDTYDAQGVVTARAEVDVSDAAIEAALAALTGELDQAVPPHSAVKVDGRRLYARARRGEVVETPVRRIRVDELNLRERRKDRLSLFTRVSKGTYVRSLAVQIGAQLGVPAHLAELRRTAVGRLTVDAARLPTEFAGEAAELRSPAEVLAGMTAVTVDAEAAVEIGYGRPLRGAALGTPAGAPWTPGEPVLILDAGGRVLAAAEAVRSWSEIGDNPEDAAVRYLCVLAATSS